MGNEDVGTKYYRMQVLLKTFFSQNWATLVSLLRLFTFSMSKPHADSRSRTVVTPLVKTVDS